MFTLRLRHWLIRSGDASSWYGLSRQLFFMCIMWTSAHRRRHRGHSWWTCVLLRALRDGTSAVSWEHFTSPNQFFLIIALSLTLPLSLSTSQRSVEHSTTADSIRLSVPARHQYRTGNNDDATERSTEKAETPSNGWNNFNKSRWPSRASSSSQPRRYTKTRWVGCFFCVFSWWEKNRFLSSH